MANPTPKVLSKNEVNAFVKAHSGWEVKNDALTRTWVFSTFLLALRFVSNIGHRAEALDHHPDIDIRWKKVTLAFITHDAGHAITELDVTLATESDRIAADTV